MSPVILLCRLLVVYICVVSNGQARKLGRAKPCYMDFCFCSKHYANCSDNGKALSHIPDISWGSIMILDFCRNYLTNVTIDTFASITKFKIKTLNLEGNEIRHISARAFSKLIHLDTLHLSDNVIDPKDLAAGFTDFPYSLDYLYLDRMDITYLPPDIFQGLRNTTVKGIHLKHNKLTQFNQSVTFGLERLITLTLEYNNISSLILTPSGTLGVLWLTSNNIHSIPDMCPGGQTLFDSLWTLGLASNMLTELNSTSFGCLKTLRYLYLSGNFFSKIPALSFSSLSNLQMLDLSDNTPHDRYLRLEAPVFNNSQLEYLNLSSSGVGTIPQHIFQLTPALRRFDLSSYKTSAFFLSSILQYSNLKALYCRHCNLKSLPHVKHMSHLTYLFLENNRIEVVPEHVFDPNPLISHLSLRNNRLTTLSSFAITYSLRYRMEYFSAADNPYICNCKLLWLKTWINTDKHMFWGQYLNYTCDQPFRFKGEPILNVGGVSEKLCLLQHSPFTAVTCVTGTAFILLVVFGLLYKWRWKIRYCFLGKKAIFTADETRPLLANDAYVVYCDEDYNSWIRNELMENFERQTTLKLSIRQRDFDLKRSRVSNVVEKLRSSRSVLIILSSNFFKDSNIQDELCLVLRCITIERIKVVLLEDIDNRYRSGQICHLLANAELLGWPEDAQQRTQFWTSLRLILGDLDLQCFS